MSNFKINYGIDLGTTNSVISRIKNGQVDVIQKDSSFLFPSCFYVDKKGREFIGVKAYAHLGDENNFSEFKAFMGTDKQYHCSVNDDIYTPEDLSANMLAEMKNSVKDDEKFNTVVITIPAAFNQTQVEATNRSAELAGFSYWELLQEPIAASMSYLKNNNNIDGKWLVFDLGGGTFDTAILEMDDKVMAIANQGKATSGDNNLGGKLFDRAIFEKIIVPYLEEKYEFNNQISDLDEKEKIYKRLKPEIESAKKMLSDDESVDFMPEYSILDDNGETIDLDFKITRDKYEDSIQEYVDRAIDIGLSLLKDTDVSSSELITILPVGGPTLTPLIRESIKSKIADKLDVSIDPMTSVSTGAAYYASTREIPPDKRPRDKNKLQLLLACPSTVTNTEAKVGVKIKDNKNDYNNYSIKFLRGDNNFESTQKSFENGSTVVTLLLNDNTINDFLVEVYDDKLNLCDCEPSSLSIMQGVKLAAPPMPHDLGISVYISNRKQDELVSIIDKGTPLPAKGMEQFKFPNDMRPANSSDICEIQLWEGKKYTKTIRNNYMGTLVINGKEVKSLIPKDTEMEITMKADESRRVKIEVYVPYNDEIYRKTFDSKAIQENISSDMFTNKIDEELDRIENLDNESNLSSRNKSKLLDIKISLDQIKNKINKQSNSEGINAELNNFNNKASQIDSVEGSLKWPEIEEELNKAYSDAEIEVIRNGNEKNKKDIDSIKKEINKIKKKKDYTAANDIITLLTTLSFSIKGKSKEFWVELVAYYHQNFNDIPWSDSDEAKNILNAVGKLLTKDDYTLDEIRNHYFNLISLLPKDKVEEIERKINIPII